MSTATRKPSDKPCPRGHLTERYISTGRCVTCTYDDYKAWAKDNRGKVKDMTKAWKQANKDYVKLKKREWNQSNKEHIWKYEGLPQPTRDVSDFCEICGKDDPSRRLALDHCHESGKFRGWLCGSCNTALGRLGDNIEGVQRALDYLRRANERSY